NVQYVAISPDMLQAPHNPDDEIDLRELWNAIWSGKWVIIAVTALFAIASVFYALSLPNIYKSEALLAPADSEQQGGLAGLAGQFGGLASIAGVNLGDAKADKSTLALEILKSRDFLSRFIKKHDILPNLMGLKGWDIGKKKLIYNDEIYSVDTETWVRDAKLLKGAKPSLQEAKREFDRIFRVEKNAETGMINLSIQHYSPYVAKSWVEWLVEDINTDMKERDKQDAENSIMYLQSQIEKTSVLEHRTLLYQLIEEQAKTLMFAEVRKEYIFKTVDPAILADEKYKPNKILLIIIAIILGGILSCLYVVLFSSKN
ncbi:MAG: hypothetical protein ACJASR_001141, partial [Psychroserpens sp.]